MTAPDSSCSYDAAANPTNVTYPNGVAATMTFNPVGALMSKQYKDSTGADILFWSQSRDGWGRVVELVGAGSYGLRNTDYGSDTAGRLTDATDYAMAGGCTIRGYGFDTASDRLTKTTTKATATAGVCPTGTTTSTTTGAVNTASQLTSTTITGAGAGTGAYVCDGLGRTTTVPGIDTNNPAGENLTLGFFSTDKPATQTLGATTQSFGLDPVGRTDTTTTTTATATGATTTASFFDGGSDSPAWTSTTGGAWTRFIHGPGGALAMQAQGTGSGASPASASLMLVNPHGDITATIPNTTDVPAAQVSGVNDTDEYGVVQTPPGPTPNGWVGAAQRSTADQGGLIQMGARQYNPATGRFLTLDPSPGGNPNPYTYPLDPVNGSDLTGQFSIGGFLSNVISAATAPIRAVVNIARAVIHTATHYTRAAASYVRRAAGTASSALRYLGGRVGAGAVAAGDAIRWAAARVSQGVVIDTGGRFGVAAVGIGPNRLQAVLTHDATRTYADWVGTGAAFASAADFGRLGLVAANVVKASLHVDPITAGAMVYLDLSALLAAESADKGGCMTFGFAPGGGSEYVSRDGNACY